MITIENELPAVDTTGVMSAVQRTDTTGHWRGFPLLEPGCQYTIKSYRCTTTNELPVVEITTGEVRGLDVRHDCSRGVIPLLRPRCEFPMK